MSRVLQLLQSQVTELLNFLLSNLLLSKLASLGIGGVGAYKEGKWRGNNSADEEETFLEVTHGLTELIEEYTIKYKSGVEHRYHSRDNFTSLNPREIRFLTYGRCFQLKTGNREEHLFFVDITSKMALYVFINLPDQFTHEDARSKVQINVGENLFIETTYDILRINNDPTCHKYGDLHNYDTCKIKEVGKILEESLGCSVPFHEKRTGGVCEEDMARRASQMFKDLIGTQLKDCPEPCVKMMTYFGFPFITRYDKPTGFVRLYFKNIVKVTEDFVSYDLLRSIFIIHRNAINVCCLV